MLHTPLPAWLDSIRPTLCPPVCNRMLYASPTGLQVMVVGGPNERSDFHVESGEEFFLQLSGGMVLRVEEGGVLRDIPIQEGEGFLLPPHIPHSPQRFAGTMGLVLERARSEGDGLDGLRWYTADGKGVLYEETFHCTDLATQLGPVIARFKASEQARTGLPDPAAQPSPLAIDRGRALGHACALAAWPAAATQQQQQPAKAAIQVQVATGAGAREVAMGRADAFLYLLKGTCAVQALCSSGEGEGPALQQLAAGDTLVVPATLPGGKAVSALQCTFPDPDTLCLIVLY